LCSHPVSTPSAAEAAQHIFQQLDGYQQNQKQDNEQSQCDEGQSTLFVP